MRLTGSVPVLSCYRLEACLDFYQSALHFVILKQRRSEQALEWVYLASGDCFLMLEKQAEDTSNQTDRTRLYFYSDDVTALHHFLQARGHVPGELRMTDYGMHEFDIVDPEGRCLSIGEKK